MVRCSLIIDGNYLLYKDVFILNKTRSLYIDLPVLLKRDLDRLMKSFCFEKIYFVTDSPRSWRKNFYKEYKGTRKKDEKIDWDFIFKTFNEFKEELSKKKNVNWLAFDGAEGDDIISYVLNENNKKGISNVIIGNDSDLHQLIRFDINSGYINMMYNYKQSDERTYWPKNYNIFMNWLENQKGNIFDMDNNEEFCTYLDSLSNRTKTREVDTEKSLFIKIVAGDRKDNVISCFKSGTRGIGEEGANSIYDIYRKSHAGDLDFDTVEFPKRLTEIIAYQKNIKDDDTLNKTQDNILFNLRLLKLTPEYLPKQLYDNMRNNIDIDALNIYKNDDFVLEDEDLTVEKFEVEKMTIEKLEIQKPTKKIVIEKTIEKDINKGMTIDKVSNNDAFDDFFEL